MYQKRSVRTSKREDCRAEGTNWRQMVRHRLLKAGRSAKNISHLSENSLKYWKRQITTFTVSSLNPAAVSSSKTQHSPVNMNLVITSTGPQTLCWPASTGSQQETCERYSCCCYSLLHPTIAIFACMHVIPASDFFRFCFTVSFLSRCVQNDFKMNKSCHLSPPLSQVTGWGEEGMGGVTWKSSQPWSKP